MLHAVGNGAGIEFFGHGPGEQRPFVLISQILQAVQVFVDERVGKMGREILSQQLGLFGVEHQGLAAADVENFQNFGLVDAHAFGKGHGLGQGGHKAAKRQIVDQLHLGGLSGLGQVEQMLAHVFEHRLGPAEAQGQRIKIP